MKCGVHVATEMELVEKQAPGWLINPDHADETGEKSNEGGVPKKRFTRKYWKCPQRGCVRVAAFDRSEEKADGEWYPRCATCGMPLEKPGICFHCLREAGEQRAARRKARKHREGFGDHAAGNGKSRSLTGVRDDRREARA